MPSREDAIVEEVITLKCGRKLGYCEHGVADGEPIVFFPGAGFGRRHVPTPFPDLLEERAVRLIAVDRPGYGLSDLHPGRCFRDWAEDVRQLMEHLELGRARFLAHSAGTAHLAAVCAFEPDLVAAASLVCPVSPIVGDPPRDRPRENFSRGCGRFLLLNFGGFLDTVFGSVIGKWQADPKAFVADAKKQIVAESDVAFMDQHPGFFREQFAADFGHAVRAPDGVPAMLDDMFHVNKVPWGFRYSDLRNSSAPGSSVPVMQVWWGDADDTAPHGEWICEQLGVEGRCVEGGGHGLIYSEFGPIIQALLQSGS